MDGATNSFVKNTIVPTRKSGDAATGRADTPRQSYWTVRREVAETEAEVRRPADLLFVNPGMRGRIGYEPGYRLIYPQRRAAYT